MFKMLLPREEVYERILSGKPLTSMMMFRPKVKCRNPIGQTFLKPLTDEVLDKLKKAKKIVP
jgi:hypothetical protein